MIAILRLMGEGRVQFKENTMYKKRTQNFKKGSTIILHPIGSEIVIVIVSLMFFSCSSQPSRVSIPASPEFIEKTTLFGVVREGDIEELKELLVEGADVNTASRGFTLLHSAALYNQPVIAEYLISQGARVTAKSEEGITPLMLAQSKGHEAVAQMLRKASRSPELQRGEPEGLRLKTGLLSWGSPQGVAEGLHNRGDPFCREFLGVRSCVICCVALGLEGEDKDATVSFIRGELYRFDIRFDSSEFSYISLVMQKRLGKPQTDKVGVVQNRMGAEFDQHEQTWLTKNTETYLEKRHSKIDEGNLRVTYLPLRPKLKEPTAGEAPF